MLNQPAKSTSLSSTKPSAFGTNANLYQTGCYFNDSSDDEGLEDYKSGGYHPAHIGEILNKRYVLIEKLGWGHFSTVWLAKDTLHSNYVAVKIQKSAQNYFDAAYDEIEILERISKQWKSQEWKSSILQYSKSLGEAIDENQISSCHCVNLLNTFVHFGPNGKHLVMVFEIMGPNLLDAIKAYNYKGIPLPIVQQIAKQMLIGLDYLHRICGLLHTDIKPENVLICLTKEELTKILVNKRLSDRTKFKYPVYLEGKSVENEPNICLYDKNTGRKLTENEIKKKKKRLIKKQKQKQKKKDQKENTIKQKEKQEDKPISKSYSDNVLMFSNALSLPRSNSTITPPNATHIQEKPTIHRKHHRKITDDVKIKIADMGNGCWTTYHFSPEIQTRQYRSPEVILKCNYGPSADIWSLACMLFELVTGDFLFEPRKGQTYGKNDDHIAQMIELLGSMPKSFAMSGRAFHKYFSIRSNSMKKIQGLLLLPLKRVLIQK